MNIILQTERLFLRQFTIDDAALIYALNSDPEVVRYVHEPATTPENALGVIEKIIIPQYQFGLGRWAVHLKASAEFIGWCGLKRLPDGEIDLGFRFKRMHWGNGYATEAAKAVVLYGFETLQLEKIIGRAHINNHASQHVLEKSGMHFIAECEEDGQPIKKYALVNNFSV